MNDTSPEMEARYHAMLLARSPEERLRMAGSMYSAARRLAVASIVAVDPPTSPGAIRRALFLRFYGHEFDAATRERIMARLGRDWTERRQIPVNWDDLETAMTTNADEWSCYLDLRSGEVQMVPVDRLRGDGEWPSEDEIDEGQAAGHLIHVEPLGSAVEYRWMAEFTVTVGDARLRDGLEIALDGRGAFRRFKNVLLDAPVERERWFAFRNARLRAATREWLAEHGITSMGISPERGQ